MKVSALLLCAACLTVTQAFDWMSSLNNLGIDTDEFTGTGNGNGNDNSDGGNHGNNIGNNGDQQNNQGNGNNGGVNGEDPFNMNGMNNVGGVNGMDNMGRGNGNNNVGGWNGNGNGGSSNGNNNLGGFNGNMNGMDNSGGRNGQGNGNNNGGAARPAPPIFSGFRPQPTTGGRIFSTTTFRPQTAARSIRPSTQEFVTTPEAYQPSTINPYPTTAYPTDGSVEGGNDYDSYGLFNWRDAARYYGYNPNTDWRAAAKDYGYKPNTDYSYKPSKQGQYYTGYQPGDWKKWLPKSLGKMSY